MPINEAPPWVREFLERKVPWWLEGPEDYLEVSFVDSNRNIAQILKDGHTYTLLPEYDRIS